MHFKELPTSRFSMMHVKFKLVPMKALPVALGGQICDNRLLGTMS